MKTLVLGSSGQVGAYLCAALADAGHDVIEYDIVNSDDQDLRVRSHKLSEAVRESDFVFFLAFDVGGSRYLKEYQHKYEFINNNVLIMSNVFEVLADAGKPFIFASSQMSNMSYSPYGVAKALGEAYTKSLNGLTVKFWNVYGVEHDQEKSHVITDFIRMAVSDGEILMMTDGTEEREFLYAEDCSEALISVMLNYETIDRDSELCITSFCSTSILEVAQIVADLIGGVIVVPSTDKDTVQQNKKNIASRAILEYWQPMTSLREGIAEIIRSMSV